MNAAPPAQGGGRGRGRRSAVAKEGRQPKKRGSMLAAVLVVLLLGLALWQLSEIRGKRDAAQAELDEYVERVARQEQENRSLEAALKRAEDPEYLQELARDKLGMVTPGQKDFYDVSN